MYKIMVTYRVRGCRLQRRALTSDVAALSKALEWAPQQLGLILKREGLLDAAAPASDALEIVSVREGWLADYPTGSEDGMSFICNRWTFTGPQGYRVVANGDGTFRVVSYNVAQTRPVYGDQAMTEDAAHALAASLARPSTLRYTTVREA